MPGYARNYSAYKRFKSSKPVVIKTTLVKKQGRKRRNNKRRSLKAVGYTNIKRMMLSTPGLPVSYWTKCPYFKYFTNITGTGTNNAYVFTTNGLFKPSTVVTDLHQPMGFKEFMGWYEHYTVTHCVATVTILNQSATLPVTVALMISADVNQVTDIETLNENGMIIKKVLSPNVGGTESGRTTISMKIDVAKVNGITKNKLVGDNLYRGDVLTNPLEQTYLHVCAYNPSSVSQVQVQCELSLVYTVKFTEPRKLTKSQAPPP